MGAGPCQHPAPWYHLPSWGGQQRGGHTQEAVIGFKVEPFGATNQFLQGLCWAVGPMPSWAATSCVSSCRHRPGTKLGPVLAVPKARGQRSRTDPAPTQPQRRTESTDGDTTPLPQWGLCTAFIMIFFNFFLTPKRGLAPASSREGSRVPGCTVRPPFAATAGCSLARWLGVLGHQHCCYLSATQQHQQQGANAARAAASLCWS